MIRIYNLYISKYHLTDHKGLTHVSVLFYDVLNEKEGVNMRNIWKRIMIAATAFFMICMTFPAAVYAETKGTKTNPFIMTAGKVMHYTWNYENSGYESEGIYNRITIPSDGCVKLTFSKPKSVLNDYYSSYYIVITDASDAEVIRFETVRDNRSTEEYMSYKIGLKKGTYLMNMICREDFSDDDYYADECKASYKYTFTKSANYESEPNNAKNTADPMKIGSVYSGDFGDDGKADFYSISLKKGGIYQLKLKGYDEMESSLSLRLISPSGKAKFFTKSLPSYYLPTAVWTFRADASGKYYIALSGRPFTYPAGYKVSVVKAPAKTVVSIDGADYLTGEAGKLGKGWKKISGKWYYFNEKGRVKGWQKIASKQYYFGEDGARVTGWQKIGKKQYYFSKKGVMITGWKKIEKKWYYFNAKGVMTTGWKKISKKWYYFDQDGIMLTGWQKISKKWYYFTSSGAMHTGWLKDGDWWLYFTSDGTMVRGKTVTIKGKKYEFLNNGVMYDRKLVLTIADELVGESGAADYLVYKLTRFALGMGGASYSRDDPECAHKIPFSKARPGDLIMYVNTDTNGVPQVGVYLGGYKSFQVVGYDAAIVDLRSIYYYGLYGYETQFWRIDRDLSDDAE